jgi:hypothetical protein
MRIIHIFVFERATLEEQRFQSRHCSEESHGNDVVHKVQVCDVRKSINVSLKGHVDVPVFTEGIKRRAFHHEAQTFVFAQGVEFRDLGLNVLSFVGRATAVVIAIAIE